MVPCFLMSASADLGPMPRMLPVCGGVWAVVGRRRLVIGGGRGHCVSLSVCVLDG